MQGKKLKRAIDDFHYFVPGTTKRINEKIIPDEMKEVDDDSERHKIGTNVWKIFGPTEHQGKIVGYDSIKKYYQLNTMMEILKIIFIMK